MMEMPAIQFIPREGLKSLYFSKGWIIVWSRSVLILTKRTAKNYIKLIFFSSSLYTVQFPSYVTPDKISSGFCNKFDLPQLIMLLISDKFDIIYYRRQ